MDKAADGFEDTFAKRIVLLEQGIDGTFSTAVYSCVIFPDLFFMDIKIYSDMDFLINKNEILFFAAFKKLNFVMDICLGLHM